METRHMERRHEGGSRVIGAHGANKRAGLGGRLVAVMLVSVLMGAGLVGLYTQPALAGGPLENEFLTLINQERVARGVEPLVEYWDISDDARRWSQEMLQAGSISHNPSLSTITTGWAGLGENVGVGPSVDGLHQAFMNSEGHRNNILDVSWDYIGIGVTVGANGLIWVTVEFMNAGPDSAVVVPGVERAMGANRYATAVAISKAAGWGPGSVVYLASGENFPDALSAGAAAGEEGGPVLYTRRDSVPQVTLDELTRIRPSKIVIVGGEAVIGNGVETQLSGYSSLVVRRGGSNRYETSILVSQEGFKGGASVVYLASGVSYADALVAGPGAIAEQGSLLLTDGETLGVGTLREIERLGASKVVLVGGTAVIGGTVEDALQGLGVEVVRYGGSNRWGTAKALSQGVFDAGNTDTVYLAYGYGWPDSVAGAPITGVRQGPVLLVGKDSIGTGVRQELERLRPSKIMIFGGPAVVGRQVEGSVGVYVN